MDVLLTNDDGIFAPGLRALYAALKAAGHAVNVVAPMSEQSGVGHSLTVFQPLRTREIADGDFRGTGVFGTPTDCVKLALGALLPKKPDLVMAGINRGPNSGPDIFYSGTVGAAAEAAHDGLPSMAISHACFGEAQDLDEVARHAVALAEKIDWKRLPPGRVLNVNYPDLPLRECGGPIVCRQSPAVWGNLYNQRQAPGGAPYWWLVGFIAEETIGENSDRALLAKGHITITPLKFEYTDRECLDILEGMDFSG